ncbi:MAG: hypothetical protein MMC33_009062 [Icmadophila ericetorum]|nr:hypothetical protein [Icmadophila ericetorum]
MIDDPDHALRLNGKDRRYLLAGLGPQAPDDVWFSRDIHNNQLQHWMLVVKYRKFELVRMAEGDYMFICDYEPGWTPDRELQKPSSKMRGGFGNGYDNWCVLRIGWSRLSKREIDRCFAAARAYYPPRLSWTQCQDFLRRFADQLVDRYDLHWRFFVDNTAIERWSVPQLTPPPAVAVQQVQQAQAQAQAQVQEQDNIMRRVNTFNTWQSGFFMAQQQNIALNNQIMQNNQNFGVGYGN